MWASDAVHFPNHSNISWAPVRMSGERSAIKQPDWVLSFVPGRPVHHIYHGTDHEIQRQPMSIPLRPMGMGDPQSFRIPPLSSMDCVPTKPAQVFRLPPVWVPQAPQPQICRSIDQPLPTHLTDHPVPHRLSRVPVNIKYTMEQVDFQRYLKEDIGAKWEHIVLLFNKQFPLQYRFNIHSHSSRFYRDNQVPAATPDWRLRFDHRGKVMMKTATVRNRGLEEFMGLPITLVEKNPSRALSYKWVLPEDKLRAKLIMLKDEREARMGILTVAGKWRRVIALAELAKRSGPRPTKVVKNRVQRDTGKGWMSVIM